MRNYFKQFNRDRDIIEMNISTATVAEAANALGVIPARIAKSISLKKGETAIIVVTAGDMKLDNNKFKSHFGYKARMLCAEEALQFTGHAVGGVCPFGLPSGIAVYLDVSLKRFQTVFPACGSGNSAIELNMEDLNKHSRNIEWVDVCKIIYP